MQNSHWFSNFPPFYVVLQHRLCREKTHNEARVRERAYGVVELWVSCCLVLGFMETYVFFWKPKKRSGLRTCLLFAVCVCQYCLEKSTLRVCLCLLWWLCRNTDAVGNLGPIRDINKSHADRRVFHMHTELLSAVRLAVPHIRNRILTTLIYCSWEKWKVSMEVFLVRKSTDIFSYLKHVLVLLEVCLTTWALVWHKTCLKTSCHGDKWFGISGFQFPELFEWIMAQTMHFSFITAKS